MHKDDQMTPNERMAGFLKGETIDRIPAMPFLVSCAGKLVGMTHKEKRSSALNQAMAQVACYEKFGNDLMIIEYGLHGLGGALGSKFSDPEDAVPAIMEYALQDLNDVGSLDPAKLELENDPWFRLNYEATQIALEKAKGEVGAGILISGPFTAAASIYKTENLLRATRKNPEKVHELLRFCTEGLKMICKKFIALGGIITLCDPIASGTILRRKQYQDFVVPYTIELMQELHDAKGMVCYHICGDTKDIITDMVETGCDMLSIDNLVDLEITKEKVGDKVCILGNVDPVEILMLGTPEIIDNKIKECFRKTYNSPKGYVIASGCDIPVEVPAENIEAFMTAARKYGKWPLDGSRYI